MMALSEFYIIGGSNCMLADSWVRQLPQIQTDAPRIRNLAVGAATSLIGIYRLLNGEVPDGATVVWEYAINEANHHLAGQSVETLLYHLDWFLHLSAQRGIRVLPLVFWNLDEQTATAPNAYRAALMAHLTRRGLQAVDFGPLLSAHARKTGLKVE